MGEHATLWAKQINHGQSQIWLEADGLKLTPHHTLATNEVVNVVRRHTTPDGRTRQFCNRLLQNCPGSTTALCWTR